MKNHDELVEVFAECSTYAGYPRKWFDEFYKTHGLPYISKYIILHLWLKELPETEHTKIMRHQLNYLNTHGHFDLTKDS